jgi:hypothetical protein
LGGALRVSRRPRGLRSSRVWHPGRWPSQKEAAIPDKRSRLDRRNRQAAEIEKNQSDLRASISASKRLAEEADAMIQRHRRECDDADAEADV